MKKKSLIISLMILVIFSTSFMGTVLARPFYKVISVKKAHNMMFVEDHPDLVVIDIRPTFAFDLGHIPGAINVPVLIPGNPPPGSFNPAAFEEWFSTDGEDLLNSKIILYCLMGPGSEMAAPEFIEAGFKKVSIIDGALSAWIAAGYDTE